MFPVLAADLGNYIGLAVLVLSFLGWIVNLIKGNNADGTPAVPRPKPNRDLRSEIEVFLEELQKPEAPRPVRNPANAPTAAQPRRSQNKPKNDKKNKTRAPQPAPVKKPALSQTSSAPMPSSVGSGIREHVAAYMDPERIGATAEKDIGHRIDAAVHRDLDGGTVAPIKPLETPGERVHPLARMMRGPGGVASAVILSEILQKPRALQRR